MVANTYKMWKSIIALTAATLTATYISRRYLLQKYLQSKEMVETILHGNAITLKFVQKGQIIQVHLPYQRRLRHRGSQTQVRLIHLNGDISDVSQMAGIPYLVSPGDLGGIRAEIIDENGEIRQVEMDDLIEI